MQLTPYPREKGAKKSPWWQLKDRFGLVCFNRKVMYQYVYVNESWSSHWPWSYSVRTPPHCEKWGSKTPNLLGSSEWSSSLSHVGEMHSDSGVKVCWCYQSFTEKTSKWLFSFQTLIDGVCAAACDFADNPYSNSLECFGAGVTPLSRSPALLVVLKTSTSSRLCT